MSAKSTSRDSNPKLQKILLASHQEFEIDFYGTKVWAPYRINIPFQPDRRRYGKESAAKIKEDTLEIAKEMDFDLKNAAKDEIRNFMKQEMIGIDCSGYAYQLLDKALGSKKSSMEQIGFPKASSTNVALLTSPTHAKKINDRAKDIRAGDLIRFGADSEGVWHALVILSVDAEKIVYGQSSAFSTPDGVNMSEITVTDPDKSLKFQQWEETLITGVNRGTLFDPDRGDGVYRLTAIKWSDDHA